MTRRLFDYSPDTGERQWYEYDHAEKKVIITTEQDVSGFLEANKRQANDADAMKRGIKESWMKAATIPNAVIAMWLAEGVDVFNRDHWPAVQRKLNDPEWRYLKTIPGRV